MTEGVGRRAFLGVAAMAPVAAAVAAPALATAGGSAAGMGAVGAFAAPDVPYPTANPTKQLAEYAKQQLGIGPWIQRGMDEMVWKGKRALLNRLSEVHERLSYRDDPSINSMKSWSPAFKDTMKHLYREEVAQTMGALREELYGSKDGPRNY